MTKDHWSIKIPNQGMVGLKCTRPRKKSVCHFWWILIFLSRWYYRKDKIVIYFWCIINMPGSGFWPVSNFHHCYPFHLCDNTWFIIHDGPFLLPCCRSRGLMNPILSSLHTPPLCHFSSLPIISNTSTPQCRNETAQMSAAHFVRN